MTPRSPEELRVRVTRELASIEDFLRRNEGMYLYPLADLDEPFWDDTVWYGAFEGEALRALCLVLDSLSMPIVSAVCAEDDAAVRWLLEQVQHQLPKRFFYNLGPGFIDTLAAGTRVEPHGAWWKMRLPAGARLRPQEGREHDEIVALGPADFDELTRFFDRDAYLEEEAGGRFFDARMLETGCYRALRENARLVAVAGVHVHSQRFGVAAIGNVATRPDRRGRGFARRLSAAVIRALQDDVATIGLNVSEDNTPAVRCYQSLGFEKVCAYEEGVASRD
jgi:GNAT superfamily N-acetyltransferase